MRKTTKNRVLTYTVVYFEAMSTRTITKKIKGICFQISEHEENPLFYITDEFSQDAFCIPFRRLLECTAAGSEVKPRVTKKKKSTVNAVVPLKARG